MPNLSRYVRRILSRYSPLSISAKQPANSPARRVAKSALSRSAGPAWKGWKKAPGSGAKIASQQSRPNRLLISVFST
ncbi:hypothetical protein D3C76_1691000 [compost metagenome]